MSRYGTLQSLQVNAASSERLWRLQIGVGVLVSFLTALARPLEDPDEGRYAEIAREMLVSHDWLVPHLNGLLYLEKPPLQYWVTAAGFAAFGLHAWVARFVCVLCAIVGAAAVGSYLQKTRGSHAATLGVSVLASSLLYFVSAQFVTLDMMLCCLLTLALTLFALAQHDWPSRMSRWRMLGCWACVGAAILTKGPVALAIPGGTLILYSVAARDFGIWRRLNPLSGLAVLAAIAAPWFALISQRLPEFFDFFFIREHVERFATNVEHREQPWWFFLAVLAIGIAPWVPPLIHSIRRRYQEPRRAEGFDVELLMLAWAAFVLIFFSISRSKLPGYILPALPALAIFIARRPDSVRATQRGRQVITAIAGIVLIAAGVALFQESLVQRLALLAPAERTDFAIGLFIGGCLLICGALSVVRVSVSWFSACAIVLCFVGFASPIYSGASLAQQILHDADAHDAPLYQVADYDQTLPFYLKRPSTLVEYRGELDFGLSRDPNRWIATVDEFERRWRADSNAVAVMPRPLYLRLASAGLPMRRIGEAGAHVAVARH